jgi:hypothetical protein
MVLMKFGAQIRGENKNQTLFSPCNFEKKITAAADIVELDQKVSNRLQGSRRIAIKDLTFLKNEKSQFYYGSMSIRSISCAKLTMAGAGLA